MPTSDFIGGGSGLLEKHVRAARTQLGWNASRRDGLVVESCIKFLASECDGAIARDRRGFSAPDAPEGHEIAAKIWGKMSLGPGDRSFSLYCLGEYQGQLEREYGTVVIKALQRNPVFASDIVNIPEGFVHPHVSFNESTGKCTIHLPVGVPEADRWETVGDLRKLFEICGTDERNAKNFEGKWRKIDWSAPGLAYHVADQGTEKLTRLLEQVGFAIDRRIEKALRKEMPPLLKAGVHEFKKDLFGLACTIQARSADSTLEGDLRAFVSDMKHPSVNLNWDDRLKKGTFAIGENILPDLKDFCDKHGVVGFEAASSLVSNPAHQKHHWKKFQGPREDVKEVLELSARPKW